MKFSQVHLLSLVICFVQYMQHNFVLNKKEAMKSNIQAALFSNLLPQALACWCRASITSMIPTTFSLNYVCPSPMLAAG